MLTAVRNVIFDWSGTLVDDLPPTLDATNAVLVKFGIPALDREMFRQRFRLPYMDFYTELLDAYGISRDDEVSDSEETLETIYHAAFLSSKERVVALPGALAFVDLCRRRGLRTYVLSAIREDHFHRQAEELGFAGSFDAVYAGVVDKREEIHQLLKTQELAAEETIFVGDMVHDIDAAAAAGVGSVAVLTGYDTAEKLLPARPDLLVKDLASVGAFLGVNGHSGRFPLATVGALLHAPDGRVLLVKTHKWSGRWGIPGGKIERGERCIEALRREMREEVGLEISNVAFVMVQDCVEPDEFMISAHFLLLNYVAQVETQAVVLNDEAEEFRWVTFEEAQALDLNEPTRVLVEQVSRDADKSYAKPA